MKKARKDCKPPAQDNASLSFACDGVAYDDDSLDEQFV